ncbi:MAG: TolC family protein [Janthinobacterium lividum]
MPNRFSLHDTRRSRRFPWFALRHAPILLLLGGCAVYRPAPLTPAQTAVDFTALGRLDVDAARLLSGPLARHRFDPARGLDMTQTAMLAVVNNPDLKLARDDVGVARAQAFSARLLPDPQVTLSNAIPTPPVTGNNITAYAFGLNYDLVALITHGTARDAAAAAQNQTDLGLLWQEWQVIARARQLFLKVRFDRGALPLLQRVRDLTLARYRAMAGAQLSFDTTGDLSAGALTAWQDAQKMLDGAQRAANQNLHDFDLVLGLRAGTVPDLIDDSAGTNPDGFDDYGVGAGDDEGLNAGDIETALAALPQRRPDLLALQAGYQAEEAKNRLAVLGQFPMLQVGFQRASDNSGYKTDAFNIGFTLPIFNRNRGAIAVERATRQRLHDDYQSRVNQAYLDVSQIRADTLLLDAQRTEAIHALPEAQRGADAAAAAYAQNDLTIGPYTDALVGALGRRLELATQEEALAEQRIALLTVLGAPLHTGSDGALHAADAADSAARPPATR